MNRLDLAFMLMTVGCVPLPLHQREISALSYKLNVLTKELKKCEVQNQKLIEALKSKPTTTIIQNPAKEQINPDQLDEIKKKALEDTERQFKIRMKK